MGLYHSGHIEFKKRYADLVVGNLGNYEWQIFNDKETLFDRR
jgi:hypothetical protein